MELKFLDFTTNPSVGDARQFQESAFCVRPRERCQAEERIRRVKSVTPVSQARTLVRSACQEKVARITHCFSCLAPPSVPSTTVRSRTSLLRHYPEEKPVLFPGTTRLARRHPERIVRRSFLPDLDQPTPRVTQFRHPAPQHPQAA